jgi:hypothetical protein
MHFIIVHYVIDNMVWWFRDRHVVPSASRGPLAAETTIGAPFQPDAEAGMVR